MNEDEELAQASARVGSGKPRPRRGIAARPPSTRPEPVPPPVPVRMAAPIPSEDDLDPWIDLRPGTGRPATTQPDVATRPITATHAATRPDPVAIATRDAAAAADIPSVEGFAAVGAPASPAGPADDARAGTDPARARPYAETATVMLPAPVVSPVVPGIAVVPEFAPAAPVVDGSAPTAPAPTAPAPTAPAPTAPAREGPVLAGPTPEAPDAVRPPGTRRLKKSILSVYLPSTVRDALARRADETGMSRGAILSMALDRHWSQLESEYGPPPSTGRFGPLPRARRQVEDGKQVQCGVTPEVATGAAVLTEVLDVNMSELATLALELELFPRAEEDQ